MIETATALTIHPDTLRLWLRQAKPKRRSSTALVPVQLVAESTQVVAEPTRSHVGVRVICIEGLSLDELAQLLQRLR